jgi:site-specific recombinase XerD
MKMHAKTVVILFRLRRNTIYCRITVNSERAKSDFSVNERVRAPVNKNQIQDGEWDSKKQQVKGNGVEAMLINNKLEQIRAKIKTCATHFMAEGRHYTAELLKDIFLGKSEISYSLIRTSELMLEYMKRQPEDEVAKGTLRGYHTRHNNMVKYLNHRRYTRLKPDEFAPSIARDFLYYMRMEHQPNASQVHAAKCLEYIKRVIHFAINEEWIRHNPLQSFAIKKGNSKPTPHLSEDDRDLLERANFSSERLQRVKDIFVFCCHTGLGFSDVSSFRASKHLNVVKDHVWLEMKRMKTSINFYVPLSAVAQDILSRYGGEQLPVISNSKMNCYLKEVAEICGITINLTVRVARRTFGMIMLNDMNLDLETVSKMLGHSSTGMTEKHYAQVLKKRIVKRLVTENADFYESSLVQPAIAIQPAPMIGFQRVKPVTLQLE